VTQERDFFTGVNGTTSAAELADVLASPAASGHYDELRGTSDQADGPDSTAAPAGISGVWDQFFTSLGVDGFADLNQRAAQVQRQIRDNGVTYNVYADADGPQRPWSLDLFPLIVTPDSWQQIEVGVLQRMRLLNHVMADVYGPQNLLKQGFLPSALVHGHSGYLRAMHNCPPVGGNHLQIAAFDLARGPDGNWAVVTQRTQAPSGLGYLLENRLIISRQFPQAFADMGVQRLASAYRALVDGMKLLCPVQTRGETPRIVLLTPGPYNETYFEHAYLARYLGLTLVEGSDLTVRGTRLFLKTLHGLQAVHGLLKRLDDEFLDPLELRADSTLGVPGLLQVVRAGHVLVANAPGSAFLESTALLGFLPALSRHLLGQELHLPSLPTWWCGEQAAMQAVLPRLSECAIKPTWPGGFGGAANSASPRNVDEWAGRIARQGDEYAVQAYQPLSQMPTWRADDDVDADTHAHIIARSVALRVFVMADPAQGPQAFRVLPGGLARLAHRELHIASMQRGGSSADVWVLTDTQSGAKVDTTTLLQHAHPSDTSQHSITSRAAENLFWLGRYTERCENSIALARLVLTCLNGEDQTSQPLLTWLSALAVQHALVLPSVPSAVLARRVFERALIADLANPAQLQGVGYNLQALKGAASSVRERLSLEQWKLVVRAERDFFEHCALNHPAQVGDGDYSVALALRALDAASDQMAAVTGAQTDRMSRDDGWRLLSAGRLIERLGFLSSSLRQGIETGAVHDEGGFEAIVALFDSTITFNAHYQQRHDIAALLELLMLDRDNPRSLGWIAQTLRGRVAKLAGSEAGEIPSMAQQVPDPKTWNLQGLLQPGMAFDAFAPFEPFENLATSHTPEAETLAEAAAPAKSTSQTGLQTQSQSQSQDGTANPYAHLLVQLQRCQTSAWQLSDTLTTHYFTHSTDARQSLGA
jgi:uncharacterized circularly permuted ATP-grasp superfamily protein/uncharacterized alpha-E superfamily protein